MYLLRIQREMFHILKKLKIINHEHNSLVKVMRFCNSETSDFFFRHYKIYSVCFYDYK